MRATVADMATTCATILHVHIYTGPCKIRLAVQKARLTPILTFSLVQSSVNYTVLHHPDMPKTPIATTSIKYDYRTVPISIIINSIHDQLENTIRQQERQYMSIHMPNIDNQETINSPEIGKPGWNSNLPILQSWKP